MGFFSGEGVFPVEAGAPIPDVDDLSPKLGRPNLGCDPILRCNKALVIFVGGFGDTANKHMFRLFERYCAAGHSAQAKAYFTHDSYSDIADYIEKWRVQYPGHQITLVGHSFGGFGSYRAALKVAEKNVKLDLLVTLDPVTNINFEQKSGFPFYSPTEPFERPVTTERWLNVYVSDPPDIPYPNSGSNRVTRLRGGPWGKLKARGLADDEWTITSTMVPADGQPQHHLDNGHTRMDILFAPVKSEVESMIR
ncbi:lipase family alpha/beta hydrolase [Lacibacterium aquatile]|uniref:Lipase family alpha/beta hydrolase n=1 Tax=Lacibacterium aquatile TaxID=1168082 RepID=A0ABW5DTE4_9PROT